MDSYSVCYFTSILSSRFIQVIANCSISVLFVAEWYSCVSNTTFAYPSFVGGQFAFTAELLRIMLWTWIDMAFSSLGYVPRNGIAGLYGNSILNFLRNHHVVFQSNCTCLHSILQGTCSTAPTSCPTLVIFWSLIVAVLMVGRSYSCVFASHFKPLLDLGGIEIF